MDDPGYIGKKWPGIVGYTEQAYIAAEWGRFRFKFGRDFIRWGSGKNGTLIFSDITRPLDHLLAAARLGPFLYTFVASALDEIELDSQTAERYGGELAQRYLSAHRLDVRLFRGRFQWAITEMALYGGVHRQLNWSYLNPFMIYHLSQLNDGGRVNTLLTTDLIVYPINKLAVYGSFLIDQEMHIRKTKSSELEPKEIAWIVGSQWADPVGVPGMTLFAEYAGVTNRTYKTAHPWETFSHRNVSMGHPIGNDFDHWRVGISQWLLGRIKVKLDYGITRKGEGGVFTPWDEPWMDVPLEEGYSEPFPTGIVEKWKQLSFNIDYFPSIYWGLHAEIHTHRRENADHVMGLSKNETYWRVGVWFDGDVILKL